MLLWSSLASVGLTLLAGVGLVGFPLAGIALIALELRGRRRPRLRALTVVLLGVVLGFALLISNDDPQFLVFAFILAAVLVGALVRAGQRGLAGWLGVSVSLPWLLFGGSVLLDAAMGAPEVKPGSVLAPFVVALGGFIGGAALLVVGRGSSVPSPAAAAAPAESRVSAGAASARPAESAESIGASSAAVAVDATSPGAPIPSMQIDMAPARRWDAASRAAIGPTINGMNLAVIASLTVLVVGSMVTASFTHGRPLPVAIAIGAIGAVLTGVLASLAWATAWPTPWRRAFEAFAWLGEFDLERFRTLTGGRLAPTLPNMRRYVRETPESARDRWIRVEMLVSSGDLDGAREMAARLPVDTVDGRIEKATYGPYLDWLAGGSGDPIELRAAVETLRPEDGDERLRGEVSVALAEVRRLVGSGDADAAAPLREVRDRIGPRARGVLVRAARRMLRDHVRLAAMLIGGLAIVDGALNL